MLDDYTKHKLTDLLASLVHASEEFEGFEHRLRNAVVIPATEKRPELLLALHLTIAENLKNDQSSNLNNV